MNPSPFITKRKPNVPLWLFLLILPCVSAPGAQVFPTGSSWKYLIGTQEASSPDPTAWRQLGFADAAWSTGTAPVGYGEADIVTTIPDSQTGGYSSVYFRKEFTIADLAEVSRLDLSITVDDGAVAWINGIEVGRINVPAGELAYNVFATAADERRTLDVSLTTTVATTLNEGVNILAVHVFNGNTTSSDLLFDASMTTTQPDFVPPTLVSVSPPPGEVNALSSVTVTFSEPVNGVNAGDLQINGFPANSIQGAPGDTTFTFGFIQPPYGAANFTFIPDHGIADTAFPPNPFDATVPAASWSYDVVDDLSPTLLTIAPPPDITVRTLTQIEVQFSESVAGVDAADLLINDQPAADVTSQPGGIYTFTFPEPLIGPVTVAWAGTAGITDLADEPNAFAGGSWTYILDPSAPPPDLVLNEIMASNQSGLLDENGEAQDWIEIWNRGATAVNLQGWSLSDDPDVPGKWVFPDAALGAGAYVVVFASEKNIRTPAPGNRFHTNFRLGILGDHIGLYSPDSPRQPAPGLIGEFPEQRNDISYGLDSGGNLRYFAAPTPGGPNGDSTIIGVVAPVHFSVSRGYFDAPFQLHLTTATPGAQIRYTTDGSEPTPARGQLYVAPLTIDKLTLLRAAAFRPDSLSSLVGTHTYLFNLSPALRSLPILSIVTDSNHLYGPTGIIGIRGGSGPPNNEWASSSPGDTNQYHNPQASLANGPAWERPTSVELIQQDNSGFAVDCGIRTHGSGWTRPRYTVDDKFAFRLYFKGDYGPDRLEYPWFPGSIDERLDEVVLRAGHNDISNPFIIDELIRRLHADMGQVASHGMFANLLVNGVPMTFRSQTANFYYNPVNRVKEGFLQAWHGGGEEWDIIAPFGDFQGGDRVVWNTMNNFIRGNSMTSQANYEQAADMLDLVNFIDYLLVNIYGSTWDWPHNNWRAARERAPGAKFRFYVWDAEGAFYIHSTRTSISPPHAHNIFLGDGAVGDASDLQNADEIASYYRQLRQNPEFRLLFADRIHKHFNNGGALTETNITARFNTMRTILSGVFAMNTRIITEWVPGRRAYLMTQFQDQGLLAPVEPPAFNRFGGRVTPGTQLTMSAPAGSIYYTTNGTDPRVPVSGAVAPDAILYAAPGLSLDQSLRILARVWNGSAWSALTEADFEVGTAGVPLRITEIMYHPAGNNSAHEYVEIQNAGSAPLNVGGFSLDGLTYVFPDGTLLAPGEYIVLASNNDPAAFAARYPGVPVFGTFAGSLDNGGERLSILDPDGNVILSVDYQDDNGWPTAADGGGSSIEILSALGAPDEPANWQASAPNGSPGVANPAPAASVVRLNEVLSDNLSAHSHEGTFPDFIELHNTSPAPVDVTGWSLSDGGNPREYVLPANTIIPANDYLVVWADDTTNTTSGLHAGFSLNRGGETLFLHDAATNRVDALSYGLQLTDLSVGRNASGAWVLNTPTPGAAIAERATASTSFLTINEWMANPLPGEDDWIELFNTSATDPVALQGIYLQSGNAVHHVTSLSFIAPSGFVQLRADENVGPDHLDFRLPALGGSIALLAPNTAVIESVTYPAQPEGASRGRYPDASPVIIAFNGSPSPGAPNYILNYNGPRLNELMARNDSLTLGADAAPLDWIEFYNPTASPFAMDGMSLSVDEAEAGQWVFPTGTSIPPQGYLVLRADASQPATTNTAAILNVGRSLDGNSGGVFLFNAAGQQVDGVAYGFQIQDRSIGRAGADWVLQDAPSPGTVNGLAAPLGDPTMLVINEWHSGSGEDWFELFNPDALPVNMAGLHLTDTPSAVGATNFTIAPLSFIAPGGFVRWEASGEPGRGRNHVNFSLDGQGELIRLYHTDLSEIDTVSFGALPGGGSEGRLPDGTTGIVAFPETASPERSNYLPLPVVISELLTHTDDPLEDAIELHNSGAQPVDLSGWYLSDNQDDFRKFTIPDNTVLPAGGYAVFYENQFNAGPGTPFALNSAHGGTVWLSEAGPGQSLTGYRARADFEAAENGVSFRRLATPFETVHVAASARSFGADTPSSLAEFRTGTGLPNPAPAVGPVVISEIMYHPPDLMIGMDLVENDRDEYIELLNITAQPVNLFDPAFATNTWRLRGGVDFDFPMGTTLPANGFLLLVGFDPVLDTAALDAFRAAYSLDPGVVILGPYQGKLGNSADTLRLRKPDSPQMPPAQDAGFVPYILVDRVAYEDALPWPAAQADGGGASLQRVGESSYGNDPFNWVVSAPTPAADNGAGVATPPVVTQAPAGASRFPGTPVSFTVQVAGTGPFHFQWRKDGVAIDGATGPSHTIPYTSIPDDGLYDVMVGNAGGTTISPPALLTITAPPIIATGPVSQKVDGGTNVTMSVYAVGPGPLLYQWFINGAPVPGANAPTLELQNVGLAENGEIRVEVSNANATVSATAQLIVLVDPVVIYPPLNLTVVEGENVTLSIEVTGTLPMSYRWRRGFNTAFQEETFQTQSFYTIPNITAALGGTGNRYTVVLTNEAYYLPGVLSSGAIITVLTDTDGDLIPDTYEMDNQLDALDIADGAEDNDLDSFTNREEYVAGTDPNDDTSYLKVESFEAGGGVGARIRFQAVAGRTYSIQFQDELNGSIWQPLADVAARASNGEITIEDPIAANVPSRIYRLATPKLE